MGNDLKLKEVDFYGDKLICYQDNQTNTVYVAMKNICRLIGIEDTKIKHQLDKIKSDCVLSKGWRKTAQVSNYGTHDIILLSVKFLHLWLAKINANLIDDSVLQNKVIKYQLEVADFLYDKFLNTVKNEQQDNELKIPTTLNLLTELQNSYGEKSMLVGRLIEIETRNQELAKTVQIMSPKVEQHDHFLSARNCLDMAEVSKIFAIKDLGRNKLFQFLRDHKILTERNLPYQMYMSKQYFKVIEVNLTEKTNGNYNVVEPKCLVTPKGVDFIYNLLKKNNYILSGTSDSYLELTQKSINNYNQQLLDDYNDDDIDIVVQTPKQQVTVHTKSDNSIFKQHSIPHMSKSMLNKLKESL